MIAGLVYAGVWLFLNVDSASLISTSVVAGAVVMVASRLVWTVMTGTRPPSLESEK